MNFGELSTEELNLLYEDYLKYLYNTTGYAIACLGNREIRESSDNSVFERLTVAYNRVSNINKELNKRYCCRDTWGDFNV